MIQIAPIDKLFIRIVTGTRYVDLYRYYVLDSLMSYGGNTIDGFANSLEIPFSSCRFILDDWATKGVLVCSKFMSDGKMVKFYELNPKFFSNGAVNYQLFDDAVGDKRTLRDGD